MGLLPGANIDRVGLAVPAGMADPLAAGDELPLGILPEGVAHPSMAAGQSHPLAHRFGDVAGVVSGDFPHGPAGHQQIHLPQAIEIGQAVQGVGDRYGEAGFLQQARETAGGELRLVTVPATLENESLFHKCPPYMALNIAGQARALLLGGKGQIDDPYHPQGLHRLNDKLLLQNS